jgi:hypothetical protein
MEPAARRAFVALVQRLLGERAQPDLEALPVEAVRRHMLAPLAFVEGAAQFRSDHLAAGLQAELRHKTLIEAVDALTAARVKVILLKGIAYAGTIYPDPAMRPMSDIDLLVAFDDVDRATHVLQRLGYWHVGGAHQWSARHHALTFKRRGGSIDLHRHLVHAGRSRIDLRAVWTDAVPSHVPGALRPSTAHERLLHVAHMGRHEMMVPLINYVDLSRLAPDPAGEKHAETWGLGRSLHAATTCLEMLRGHAAASDWWIPPLGDLLDGTEPPRWLQILRKIHYVDGARGLYSLLRAGVEAQARRFSVIGRTRP